MGKILKYCTSCEEGFAEKFSFCPNCAKELSAFEMTPVSKDAVSEVSEPIEEPLETAPEKIDEPVVEAEEEILTVIKDTSPVGEKVVKRIEAEAEKESEKETVFEPVAFDADDAETTLDEDIPEADPEKTLAFDSGNDIEDITEIEVEEPEEVETVFGSTSSVIAADTLDEIGTDDVVEEVVAEPDYSYRFEDDEVDDDDYAVTVIGPEGSKLKSSLLMGASVLVLTVAISSVAYSLFNSPLFVAAIGGDQILLAPPDFGPLDI